MNTVLYYILIAKNYPTVYEESEWAFEHLELKGNLHEIGSWDRDYAEFFQLGIL